MLRKIEEEMRKKNKLEENYSEAKQRERQYVNLENICISKGMEYVSFHTSTHQMNSIFRDLKFL